VERALRAEAALPDWMSALEQRHLANLRVSEVTRALRALSAAYVERRHGSATKTPGQHKVRGTLESAGKRAAFALFYAPLHFMAVSRLVTALDANRPAPSSIIDLGCGTGAAGAAWALIASPTPTVTGIDRHPWAVDEARWTYAHFGLRGRTRAADLWPMPIARAGDAIVAAYVLNELADAARERVEEALLAAAGRGTRVLIVEPISRAVTPWWDATAARMMAFGGRSDEWRWQLELPPIVKVLDKAAGLDHRELRCRTLFV